MGVGVSGAKTMCSLLSQADPEQLGSRAGLGDLEGHPDSVGGGVGVNSPRPSSRALCTLGQPEVSSLPHTLQ